MRRRCLVGAAKLVPLPPTATWAFSMSNLTLIATGRFTATSRSPPDASGVEKAIQYVLSRVPPNTIVPLQQLSAELPDDIMDELSAAGFSLKKVFETHPQDYAIAAFPPHNRLCVSHRTATVSLPSASVPLASLPPAPLFAKVEATGAQSSEQPIAKKKDIPETSEPKQPSKSSTLKALAKALGVQELKDCWSLPRTPRNFIQEHAELLMTDNCTSSEWRSAAVRVGTAGSISVTQSHMPLHQSQLKDLCIALLSLLREDSAAEADTVVCTPHQLNLLMCEVFMHVLLPNKHMLLCQAVEIHRSESSSSSDMEILRFRPQALDDPEVISMFSASSKSSTESSGNGTLLRREFVVYVSLHPRVSLKYYSDGVENYATQPVAQALSRQRAEPLEFDAYRIARLLCVNAPMPWSELCQRAAGMLADDSLLTLVGVVLAFPTLLEMVVSSDAGGSSGGVRFRLHPNFIPADLANMEEEFLKAQSQTYYTQSKAAEANRHRVMMLTLHRYYKRLYYAKLQLTPACDPDVIAYWLYDLMDPLERCPPPTGEVQKLLPLEAQQRCDARNKVFLAQYPELFAVRYVPPTWVLMRREWSTLLEVDHESKKAMSLEEKLRVLHGAYRAMTNGSDRPLKFSVFITNIPNRKDMRGPALKKLLAASDFLTMNESDGTVCARSLVFFKDM